MDPVTRTVSAVTLSGEEEPGVTFMGQRYPLRYMALRPDAAGTGPEPPGGGYDGRTVQETLAMARRPASLANALAWSDRAMAVTQSALDALNRGEPADGVTQQWSSAVTQGQALPPAGAADTLGQRLGLAVVPLLGSAQDLLRETMEQQRAAEDRAAGQAWAKRYAHLASLAPEALLRSTAQRIGEVVGDAALGRMLLDQARREKVARKLAADPSHDWRADPLLEGVDPLVLKDLEVTQRDLLRARESREQAERHRERGGFHARLRAGYQDALAGIATPAVRREDFLSVYGAEEGERRWASWQGRQKQAPSYAAVRGRSAEEIAAHRQRLKDPRLFDRIAGEDAAERLADPAGYALRWLPGLSASLEGASGEEAWDRLWMAQEELGIAPSRRSPWTQAQAREIAWRFEALGEQPPGAARTRAKAELLGETLLSLPPEYREGARAQLERLGADLGPSGSLPDMMGGLVAEAIKGSAVPDGQESGKPIIDPATAGAPVLAQVLPLPGAGTLPPAVPGSPSPTEALHQLDRLFQGAEDERRAGVRNGAWVVSEAVKDGVAAGEAAAVVPIEIVPREELVRDPAQRRVIDRLTLDGGLSWTEAATVVGEFEALHRQGTLPMEPGAVAGLYATVMPSGSGSREEQRAASQALGEFFQSLQAEGRITLAELKLLERSPAYVQASGRGAAWVDERHQVVGTWAEVLDNGLAVLESDDGLFFVSRDGRGEWVVEEAFSAAEIDRLHQDGADGGERRKEEGRSEGAAASGSPDPEEDPEDDEDYGDEGSSGNHVYRFINRKDGSIEYVGITRNFIQRAWYWLRKSNFNIKAIENLPPLTRLRARAIEIFLILYHGRIINGTGSLRNKILSISPKNPYYDKLMRWAEKYLRSIGYPL